MHRGMQRRYPSIHAPHVALLLRRSRSWVSAHNENTTAGRGVPTTSNILCIEWRGADVVEKRMADRPRGLIFGLFVSPGTAYQTMPRLLGIKVLGKHRAGGMIKCYPHTCGVHMGVHTYGGHLHMGGPYMGSNLFLYAYQIRRSILFTTNYSLHLLALYRVSNSLHIYSSELGHYNIAYSCSRVSID